MRKLIPVILWLACVPAFAQQQAVEVETHRFDWPLGGQVNVQQILVDWAPNLQRISERPAPDGRWDRREKARVKALVKEMFPQGGTYSQKHSSAAPKPLVVSGFEGNLMGGGVPNDNDMAISNSGVVISVINSNIYIFDSNDSSTLDNVSLASFGLPLGHPDHKFDPKVVYDPKLDRFMIVYLSGSTSTTNNVIIAFAQSSDPTGDWNLYSVSGNPLNTNVWSDYPIIGISDDELFICLNFIKDDSSWQAGFSQSIIWQVDKQSGFGGGTLKTKLHTGIKFGSVNVRNITPVQGGTTTYGPNMYFLSNKNFAAQDDRIYILEITDVIDGGGAFTVMERNADVQYGMPPQGRQKFPHEFDTNDGRILAAFLENNTVQFVNNCVIPSTGFAGIYHGIIEDFDGARKVKGNLLGDPVLDIAYPNISYSGLNESDNQAIINFNHSGPDTFAGFSCIFYRNDGTYSDRKILKQGTVTVNMLTALNERWGDYSGSQLKYNEPGVVWACGSFGKQIGSNEGTGTWIAGLKTPDQTPPGGAIPAETNMRLYPVPAWDMVNVEFDAPEDMQLDFYLYDVNGKQITFFLTEPVNAGTHRFWFNAEPLNAGIYFVRVLNGGKEVATKKIVKF